MNLPPPDVALWLNLVITIVAVVLLLWRREKKSQSEKSRKRPFVRFSSIQALPDERVEIIPSPSWERSKLAAAERRDHLFSFLQRFEVSLEQDAAESRRALPMEFLEVPPAFRSRELSGTSIEGYDERAGQMARLRWQLKSDHLLLVERVVDAIVASRRILGPERKLYDQSPQPFSIEYPLVRLSAYDSRLDSRGLFPWKVVIESDRPLRDFQVISDMNDWLGIGVDLAPRRRVRLFGRCQMPGGLDGVVGGILHDGVAEYAMTCSHVLAANCGSVFLRGNPTRESNQPDAALIRGSNPCFRLSDLLVNCVSADEAFIEQSIQKKSTVEKRHPNVRQNKGVIRSRVSAFDLNGYLFRFPHLEVLPWNSKLSRFTRLFDRPFSKEGDSGSWVFDVASDRWLGMVVGGDDYFTTFIAEAAPLVDYFDAALVNSVGAHAPLETKYQEKR